MKILTEAELADLERKAREVTDAEQLDQRARELVMAARRLGLVLTIEQRPLLPLAMGNYWSVVSVRKARGAA